MLSQRIDPEQRNGTVVTMNSNAASGALSADDQQLMAQYGISLTPLNRFEYGSFAYSSLDLAVAQARQAERRGLLG